MIASYQDLGPWRGLLSSWGNEPIANRDTENDLMIHDGKTLLPVCNTKKVTCLLSQ